MEGRICGDDSNDLGDVFLPDVPLRKSEYFDHGVYVPFLSGCILLASHTDLVRKLFLEIAIRYKQVVQKFLSDRFNVLCVGNLEEQVESLLLNDKIMVFKAVCDCLLVSLHSVIININNALETLKCDKSNIIFPIHKESSEDVDSKHAKASACLDAHDSADAFSEN